MKKTLVFSVIVSAILCTPVFAYDWSTNPGDGSPDNPYQISTPEQLMAIGSDPNLLNKHFILTNNIVFNPEDNPQHIFKDALIAPDTLNDDAGIFQGDAFSGNFNGNGYKVSKLTIVSQADYSDYLGLFGLIGEGGQVNNLGIDKCLLLGETSIACGGLAGCNYSGTISNCYSTGQVYGWGYFGGLVGINNSGEITQCFSTIYASGYQPAGGLAGYNYGGTIKNCYTIGTITKIRGGGEVGGLVGINDNNGTIINCYSAGEAIGFGHAGGLIGYNNGYVVDSSYWDTETSQLSYSDGGVGLETTLMKQMSSYSGWDFIDTDGDPANWQMPTNNYPALVWEPLIVVPEIVGLSEQQAIDELKALNVGWKIEYVHLKDISAGIIASQYPESGKQLMALHDNIVMIVVSRGPFSEVGDGTSEAPYQIYDPNQLIALGQDVTLYDKHFVLVNDLIFDPESNPEHIFDKAVIAPDADPSTWDYQGRTFGGSFDGNEFTIKNLTINNKAASYLGLFGWVDSGAEISNLGIENVRIIGNETVGGLAGRSDLSIIINCHVTGLITGENSTIGGLIGFNNSTIRNCYTAGTISGGGFLGGLIGFNVHNIIQCYSTASINGMDDPSGLGGLIGYESGGRFDVVSQCYATGSVAGGSKSRDIGGLIGEVHGGGHINQCYATGRVSGSGAIGALAGYVYRGRISNSLCNLETQPSYVHSPLGYSQESSIINVFGKSISELLTQATYTDIGWDFFFETENGTEDIWFIREGLYSPKLWWEITPIDSLGMLTDDVTELIQSNGIENSLLAKLATALQKLEDDNENNDGAAINSLEAFINAVNAQRGKKISEEDADYFIMTAQEIINMLL